MSWSIITGNITATAGDSYFCAGNSTINVTLPTSTTLGDTFTVYSLNTNGWNVAQAAGQQIRYNGTLSTLGTTGGFTGSNTSNSATFVYCNGIWEVTSSQGGVYPF